MTHTLLLPLWNHFEILLLITAHWKLLNLSKCLYQRPNNYTKPASWCFSSAAEVGEQGMRRLHPENCRMRRISLCINRKKTNIRWRMGSCTVHLVPPPLKGIRRPGLSPELRVIKCLHVTCHLHPQNPLRL